MVERLRFGASWPDALDRPRVRGRVSTFALALLSLAVLWVAIAVPAEALTFMPRTDYDGGYDPTGAVADDFNGDGRVDLAVVNDADADIRVFLGTGGGAFGAGADFATGSYVRDVVSGDLNGDGSRDLVTVDYNDEGVSVHLGNGLGGFSTRSVIDLGGGAMSVAVADFNGDGDQDLAVGRSGGTPDGVALLLGDGSGGFGPRADFACPYPLDVAAADLDGDGKTDLVVTNTGAGAVAVLLGDGSGGFGPAATYYTADAAHDRPRSIGVGDFDGDGVPDVVTANDATGKVSVWLGDGDGSLGPATDVAVGYRATCVAVADLEGDGKKDLAVADWAANAVYVLCGDGSGGFAAPVSLATGGSPTALVACDLSGDGKPDLATGNHASVSVLLQPPAITIGAPTAASVWPSGSTQTVSWSITAPVSAGEFRVWLISAGGTWYVAKQVLPAVNFTAYSTSIIAAVPAASGYRAAVYWRPVVGSGSWIVTAKSAAFTVTPINITSPGTSAVWPVNTTQTVGWTVDPAVSTGEFRVWLISANGTWYVNRQVLAVDGKTSYAASVTTAVPAGAGYKAAVYWRPVVGAGSWVATTKSGTFSIASLAVTEPAAGSSWPRSGIRTVSWTVTPSVSGGEFRVWLVSPSGGWYVGKQVLPVLLRTSYSTQITYSVPPAVGYKVAVYWRRTISVPAVWILTAKSAAFTVNP